MNLYIFNETRRGAVYGVGTYISELTVALKGSEINICVVNLLSDKPQIQYEDVDGIRYWCFPAPIQEQWTSVNQKQRELYLRNVVYLLQLHIQDKTNLIFHLNYLESSKLAEELKNTFDCRIITTVHYVDWGFTMYDNLPQLQNILSDAHPDDFGNKLQKTVEEDKSYYAKADRIICYSHYMYDVMCRYYDAEPAKTFFIANGMQDNEQLKEKNYELRIAKQRSAVAKYELNKTILRKKWNIRAREKIILFVGRVDEIKGLSYLIESYRHVLSFYSQSRLVIAGEGNYAKYIKDSQDICANITFTGMLDKTQLQEWYCLSDIGVMPSLFETFGYVAAEMMMYGLPVVATATSGLNEVIDDTCGLQIPLIKYPDKVEIDTGLLTEKILYLLEHPKEAKMMGQNGRKRYLEKYSLPEFRKNMLDFYRSLDIAP